MLLAEDDSIFQPYFFDWGCFLHALSLLLLNICELPFIKSIFGKHKVIIATVRNKQWTRDQLGVKQLALKENFRDRAWHFRSLTLKKWAATRIGSLPLSIKRNVLLKEALDAVVSDPDYFIKCGVSATRAQEAAVEVEEEEEDEEEEEEEEEEEQEQEEEKEAEVVEEEETTKAAKLQMRYIAVRRNIRDDKFWQETSEYVAAIAMLMRALKHADEGRPLMGCVWPLMYELYRRAEKDLLSETYTGAMPLDQRK
jgi:flagellar biosynthesis GTPase FlhF